MRDGERRHHFDDVHQCRAGAGRWFPTALATVQHRRQQKCDQEKDVVVAGPNMPNSFADKIREPSAHLFFTNHKPLRWLLRTENRRSGAIWQVKAEKSTVQWVSIVEEAVSD